VPQDLIEKLYDITSFVVKFYKEENKISDSLMDLEDKFEVQEKIERLLLLNLNQNFQLLKSDFSQALSLIYDYLRASP
jgi:hypothetical protein